MRHPSTLRHSPERRPARRGPIGALLLLSLFGLPLPTCGGRIEPEPLLDDEGNVIATPPPLEDWLRIESLSHTNQSTLSSTPSFLIRFNQYIQEDSALSYGVVSLQTGGRTVGGSYAPVMTERALIWTAHQPLRDGFEYKLTVNLEGLESVTGAPTIPNDSTSILFLVDDALEPEPSPTSLDLDLDVSWQDVKQLFEERQCYTCHGQPSWHELNALTYDALVGERSSQSKHMLVRFKDPTNSYLMHKLLPDYPIRRGTVQPPPWADEASNQPLSKEELWLVERWIRRGAPRSDVERLF